MCQMAGQCDERPGEESWILGGEKYSHWSRCQKKQTKRIKGWKGRQPRPRRLNRKLRIPRGELSNKYLGYVAKGRDGNRTSLTTPLLSPVKAMKRIERFNAEVWRRVDSIIGKWRYFGSPFANGAFVVVMQTAPSRFGLYTLGVKTTSRLTTLGNLTLQHNVWISIGDSEYQVVGMEIVKQPTGYLRVCSVLKRWA